MDNKSIKELTEQLKYRISTKVVNDYNVIRCPSCSIELKAYYDGHWHGERVNACPNCGQLVRWE